MLSCLLTLFKHEYVLLHFSHLNLLLSAADWLLVLGLSGLGLSGLGWGWDF
jgi:hypothetical protein